MMLMMIEALGMDAFPERVCEGEWTYNRADLLVTLAFKLLREEESSLKTN